MRDVKSVIYKVSPKICGLQVSILMHDVFSLSDATSYDKLFCAHM